MAKRILIKINTKVKTEQRVKDVVHVYTMMPPLETHRRVVVAHGSINVRVSAD